MSFHATDAGFSARTIRLSTFRNHLMSSVCAGLIIAAAGPSAHAQQVPSKYFNADGSRTNDYEAAKRSWLADKEFQGNWGLKAIHAEAAYVLGITGRGMISGVLDSGTLETHPKFSGSGKFISIHSQGNRDHIDDYTSAGTWIILNPPIHVGDYFNFYGGIPVVNDAHGTHTGGTIAGRREGGKGEMQGVAFDAVLAAANGTEMGPYVGTIDTFDSSIFAAAIDGFAEKRVPVVNNSWGIGPSTLGGMPNIESNYGRNPFNFVRDVIPQYQSDPSKKMFNIAEDAVKKHDIQFVFAAGNNGPGATPDAMVSLPYFRPELEGHWLSVTGIGQTGIPIPGYSDYKIYAGSSRCEQTKWYCITAPAVDVKSSFFEYDKQSGGLTPTFNNDTGNSMAAPHVTGAMTLIMQRFNYLNSVAAHDILLTTATYLPDGSGNDKLNIAGSRTQIPNERSGWGLVNLENSMNGPGQFLGRVEANLNTGVNDVWRNDISDLALDQRKIDEQTEVSSWTDRKKAQGWENGVPQSRRLAVEAATKADLDKMGSLFTSLFTTSVARLNNSLEVKNAYGAIEADANAKRFRDNFIKADPYAFGRPNLQELYEAYKLTTIRAEIAAATPADKDSLEKSAGLFGAFVEKLVGGQKDMADYLMILNTVNTNPVTLPLILKYQKQNPKWWESADALKNYGVFKTEVLDPLFAVHMHGAFDAVVAEYTVSEARAAYLTKKLSDPSAYLGGLTKSGAKSLWLTGKNTYRGDTIVNGGELGIAAEGSIISASIINNTGLLTVDGKTAAVTANPGGRLKVNTPGVTGAVTLNGGVASVDGTSGATEVNAGGELGGIGTVGSLAVHAGGMVSPGNSIGTLHVAGPANFDKATGLTIQVAADGRSDRLDVKGKATLLGGVLIVAPENSKAPL
ncbi:S8 family peptidase, partial [Phyllobacterium sp. OV277]|uniref:S8 family peptidase n=1 Tax=Phyllobacterium sp. OV277 TaxID=1882772 RepID=UPI000888948B